MATQNKTLGTDASVDNFLSSIEPEKKRLDSQALDVLFRKITGWRPVMWGPSMIGYGSYHYRYESGREGDFLATGFAPRKANLSIHIMPGYQDYSAILNRLGKHKIGKSCLYLNKLADVDVAVLEELIHTGLSDLASKYPVTPS